MPPLPRKTNEELIATWCDYMAYNKGRARGTVDKYRGYMQRLEKHYAGRSLLELQDYEIRLWAGDICAKSGLAGQSRRAVVSALRGFYSWAVRARELQESPAADLEYPHAPRVLPLPIDLANAERLMWAPDLGTFKGLRDAALFSLLVGCGARLSGLVRLNQEDLLATGSGKDQRILIRLKEKGDRERRAPVPRDAELLLSAYLGHPDLEQIDRRIEIVEEGRKRTGRVLFVSTGNRRIAPSDYKGERRRLTARGVQYLILFYGRKQGIPEDQLHPHAMRHLFGAQLAESEPDQLMRQILLGHADPRSTELYSHVAYGRLIASSDKSNPLARMNTPASELLKALRASASPGDV